MASKVPLLLQLNSGHSIPRLGLGTWLSKPNEVHHAVKYALENSYRHIDCAWIYGNEEEVGAALKEKFASGIKRTDVFITSKIWNTFHRRDGVKEQLKQTLKNLGLEYLDLLLIHWPFAFRPGEKSFPTADGQVLLDDVPFKETYQALEEAVSAGYVKSIGVSNFNVKQLSEVLSFAKIPPAMNQVEVHPYLTQTELVNFCRKHNIAVTAYSPLGNAGRPGAKSSDPILLEDPKVLELARKYNKTAAQILVRFQLDYGNVVIPKSVSEARIIENGNVLDFQLDEADLKALLSLDRNWRSCPFSEAKHSWNYPF